MGQEIKCQVDYGGQSSEGRALLETGELIFRGEAFRLKIPLPSVTGVEAAGGRLIVTFTSGVAVFHLGTAASKWADKILHPPSRLDKLGVKSGTRYAAIGAFDADFLSELSASGALPADPPEIVFLAAADKPALQSLVPTPARTIWVIYPKGVKTITELDVLHAGRAAGLVDTKVASFSTTHTALKFVHRTSHPGV